MLLQRSIVVLILGPLTLFMIHLGGWFYFIPIAGLLSIAAIEYSQLVGQLGWKSPLWILIPASLLLWFLPQDVQFLLFGDGGIQQDFVDIVLIGGLFAAMAYALWLFEKRTDVDSPGAWAASALGILFI